MKTTYTVTEAKAQLSKLLAEVERGESISIARGRTVIARLVPAGPAEAKAERVLGAWAGKVRESADCWADDPAVTALFEGDDEGMMAAEPVTTYGSARTKPAAKSSGTKSAPMAKKSPARGRRTKS